MGKSVVSAALVGGAALVLTGCGPSPITPVSYVADGLSALHSGKGVSDHVVSSVVGRDCAFFRVLRGESICRDVHHDVEVPEGMELITTARRPIFVAAPHEQVAEGGSRGARPYLTDTAIWRADGIDSSEEIQEQVAAHAVAPALPTNRQYAQTPQTPADILDYEVPLQGSLTVADVQVETLAPITAVAESPVAVAEPQLSQMPIPPRRPDATVFAPVATVASAVQARSEQQSTNVQATAAPLELASANPPSIIVRVPVAVASVEAGIPVPPRRPGWFAELAAENVVVAESPFPPRRPNADEVADLIPQLADLSIR